MVLINFRDSIQKSESAIRSIQIKLFTSDIVKLPEYLLQSNYPVTKKHSELLESLQQLEDDPDDIDFECRLPNAFVADPPLEQVVSKNREIGYRIQKGRHSRN